MNEKEILLNEFEKLKIKEQEIKNKILEINILSNSVTNTINKYNYMFKTHYLQLEITNNENKSSYIWNFNQPIKEINSIKLMSYSIPEPKYNINKNINDKLNIMIEDEIYEILIPFGFYDIYQLIEKINDSLKNLLNNIETIDKKKIDNIEIDNDNKNKILEEIESDDKKINKSNTSEVSESDDSKNNDKKLNKSNISEVSECEDLKNNDKKLNKGNKQKNVKNKELEKSIKSLKYILFEIDNFTKKIKINSNINYKLISTSLIKNNLGFINLQQIADNTWDLRLDSKVYLFLQNLSDNIPFGILYFVKNNLSICNFNFTESIVLDKLEIVFADENGLEYNFYNLPHELNFVIEKNI